MDLMKMFALLLFSFQMLMFQTTAGDLCGDVQCPEDKPFCSEAGCVFECPKPFYINASACVISCGKWFVEGRHCVKNCSENLYMKENLLAIGSIPYMEKQCVEACDYFNEYIYRNTCVRACPLTHKFINDRICLTQCPEQTPLMRTFSINDIVYYRCVSSCYGQLIDGLNCTEKCSVNKSIFNSTCVDKCPESHPFLVDNHCVQKCPDDTVLVSNNHCLNNCTKSEPFYLNNQCSEKCTKNFYITDRRGVLYCEEKCQPSEFSFKNTCRKSCKGDSSRNYYLYHLNSTCTEVCPVNFFSTYDKSSNTGKCVSACSSNEVVYNRTCLDTCPLGTVLNDSECQKKCPVEYPLSCLVTKGDRCSSYGPAPNTRSIDICVSDCPKDMVIFNGSCLKKCPKYYKVYQHSCVFTCPYNNSYIRNETITMKQWYQDSFFYHWNLENYKESILMCAPKCPDNMLIHNSTCVSKCPETFPYIVNRTCQKETCDAEYMYRNSSGIICTDKCRDEDYIYNRTCVAKCPENVYVTNRTCHETKCNTRYQYNTSSLTICTDDCKDFGFIDGQTCTTQCPFYVLNAVCVDTCPGDFNLVVNQTKSKYCTSDECRYTFNYTECVNKCPSYLLQLNDHCLESCSNTNYMYEFDGACVKACPSSHPYRQTMKHNNLKLERTMCVNKCHAKKFLDKTSNTCVEKCPNITPFIHRSTCVDECPKDLMLNEMEHGIECSKMCPSQKLNYGRKCVTVCPKNTYNLNNSKCVYECPNTQPFGLTEEHWRCIEKCEDSKVFINGTCISSYDCDEPSFVFSGQCIKTCPTGYFYWEYSGCEKRWQNGDIITVSINLGLFVILVWLFRLTLKELFAVLLMLICKVDDRADKDDSEEHNNVNGEDDKRPLVTNNDCGDNCEEI